MNRYGKYLHLIRERIETIERWYHKRGNWLLTVGYYIPGVRHFTAFVVGMPCLDYKMFAVFAYLGAAIWVASFLALGYVVGENWKVSADFVERYSIMATLVAIAGAVIYWLRTQPGACAPLIAPEAKSCSLRFFTKIPPPPRRGDTGE